MWFSALPAPLKLHIQNPLPISSTVPPLDMSKPSKTCLSDFISKLLNLSYPSALGLHEEEGKSFSDVVKEDIQMVDVTVWNCLELLNTLCNNNAIIIIMTMHWGQLLVGIPEFPRIPWHVDWRSLWLVDVPRHHLTLTFGIMWKTCSSTLI